MAKKERIINKPLKKKPQRTYYKSYQPPMASTRERVSNLNIHKIVGRILLSGQLSRQEYVHLLPLCSLTTRLLTKNVLS